MVGVFLRALIDAHDGFCYNKEDNANMSDQIPSALLSIRLLDGEVVKAKFPAQAKLEKVAQYVCQKAKDLKKDKLPKGKAYTTPNGIEFETTHPKKLYEVETFSEVTLEQAGLTPRFV
jgi:hypothetical protein